MPTTMRPAGNLAPVASTPMCEHPSDPYGDAVFVHVGPSHQVTTWELRSSMLCFYSGWFRRMITPAGDLACCNNDNTDRTDFTFPLEIELPGDDAHVFDMVLYQLINRRFFDSTSEQGAVLGFDRIIDLYSFGEKRDMPLVQNAASDLFARKIRYCRELPSRWSTEYLWEKSMPGSKLRKLLVEFVRAMCRPHRHLSQIWATLIHGTSDNPDRLVYAMNKVQEEGLVTIRVAHATWRRLQSCEWHVHEQGVCCELAEEAILDRGRGEDDADRGLERGGRGPHRGIASHRDNPSAYFG